MHLQVTVHLTLSGALTVALWWHWRDAARLSPPPEMAPLEVWLTALVYSPCPVRNPASHENDSEDLTFGRRSHSFPSCLTGVPSRKNSGRRNNLRPGHFLTALPKRRS